MSAGDRHDPLARLMTKSQAAAYCGTTLPTFGNWVKQGWMPPALPMGRWDRHAIDAAIDKMSGITTAPSAKTESALEKWQREHGSKEDAYDKWKREHDARRARRAAKAPSKPFTYLEKNALRQLRAFGRNWADHYRIKECGPVTVRSLVARGLIETKSHQTDPKSIIAYSLTADGLAAAEALDAD